jgi:hypothetical protein
MKAKLYGEVLGHSLIEIPFNKELDSIILRRVNSMIPGVKSRPFELDIDPYYVSFSSFEIKRIKPTIAPGKKARDIDISRSFYIAIATSWRIQEKTQLLHFEFLRSMFEK